MSTPVYFFTLALIAGTILAVFGMKYLAVRARDAGAAEHDARLASIEADIAKLSASVAKIESILKEVE